MRLLSLLLTLLLGAAGTLAGGPLTFTFTTVDFPGAQITSAVGINDPGEVVGLYTTPSVHLGFLLSGNNYTTIDFPGTTFTDPSSINDAGQIVGFYAKNGNHGLLLSGNSFTTIDFPGATSTSVSDINDADQIVGSYDLHGFLATPASEPATPILLGVGFSALFIWKRRSRERKDIPNP